MRTLRLTFAEVVVRPKKSGICPGCGGKATRSGRFSQTINPFNTNKDGQQKSPKEIRQELDEKVKAWKLEPTWHARCEP